MKNFSIVSFCILASISFKNGIFAQNMSFGADNFYKSQNVTATRVIFMNQFRMEIIANLFTPNNLNGTGKYSAIIVGHPMGAVKEQVSNLYAQKLAERGFVTLALDQAYWGESDGLPRNTVSPDIYAETFSAAVDFLGTRIPFVDRERIGVLGICGSGGFVISAAKIDPRMKAIATVSMYDMGGANRRGIRNSLSVDLRNRIIAAAAAQRYVEFAGGQTAFGNGTFHDGYDPAIMAEFADFYNTPRGQYPPNGTTIQGAPVVQPTVVSNVRFINFYPFIGIDSISPRGMLFITGENAHSREFSEEAYQLAADPKELFIVNGAGHVDLYDRVQLIPFDKLEQFYRQYL